MRRVWLQDVHVLDAPPDVALPDLALARPVSDPDRTALISADGVYRYRLGRAWGNGPLAAFVMLNPSTADGEVDDPTIRRCIGFAKSWGCGSLVVVNLYALRATDPRELLTRPDPIGPENLFHVGAVAQGADLLVCAWGASIPPADLTHHKAISSALRRQGAYHLGLTKTGHPRHPLYLAASTPLTRWSP